MDTKVILKDNQLFSSKGRAASSNPTKQDTGFTGILLLEWWSEIKDLVA